MGAADRVEGGIDASAAIVCVELCCSELAHCYDEVAVAIVDCLGPKAFDHGQVDGRAGTDGVQTKMPRQIEQRRADRARGPDREGRGTRRQLAVRSEEHT